MLIAKMPWQHWGWRLSLNVYHQWWPVWVENQIIRPPLTLWEVPKPRKCTFTSINPAIPNKPTQQTTDGQPPIKKSQNAGMCLVNMVKELSWLSVEGHSHTHRLQLESESQDEEEKQREQLDTASHTTRLGKGVPLMWSWVMCLQIKFVDCDWLWIFFSSVVLLPQP